MSALALDAIAGYFGWAPSYTYGFGRRSISGQFGRCVFWLSCNDGLVNASCTVSNGSLTPGNDFVVHIADPDLFGRLEGFFRSWEPVRGASEL